MSTKPNEDRRYSYEFIESAILLNLDIKRFKSFKYTSKDFSRHGEILLFIREHFIKYGEIPSSDTLLNEYATLDKTSISVTYEYALDQFKKQLQSRNMINIIQRHEKDIVLEPQKALSAIMNGLTDIEIKYDEDVVEYDDGSLDRLDEWNERVGLRQKGDGLLGIATSFKSINKTGVGWMPGDLVSLYARPSVGKTWICVSAAATAAMNGVRTLLISTETPVLDIKMRLDVVVANQMGYSFSHDSLRRGESIDSLKYADFLESIKSKNLLICDHISGDPSISTDSIAALVRKHSPEFLVIDGAYLVQTGEKNKASWEQSHTLFYNLKNLAVATKTPVFVTTQANREASDIYKPPQAGQVAFGDALLRASDVALSMSAVENSANKRAIQVQKYRNGSLNIDTMYLQWDVNIGHIEELEGYETTNY